MHVTVPGKRIYACGLVGRNAFIWQVKKSGKGEAIELTSGEHLPCD